MIDTTSPPKKIFVEVTQSNIDKGWACMSYACPLALALNQIFRTTTARVEDKITVVTVNEMQEPIFEFRLKHSHSSLNFMISLDAGREVVPQKFELTVQEIVDLKTGKIRKVSK